MNNVYRVGDKVICLDAGQSTVLEFGGVYTVGIVEGGNIELKEFDVAHSFHSKRFIHYCQSYKHEINDLLGFINRYKRTRNYALLTQEGKKQDWAIFGGLMRGEGFSCVYSAWEVYMEMIEEKRES